ncbi:hypothetical protein I603_2388 [Erythrobacter dokdonensis DSW-74]|uniref:Uncharacterized protein n=1 Tax=Erythrobacter dokdonensis DSW-74 TaxID=1300349 RepID=A0A1A7BFA5_9SPHN|nr:hypothetical protein I603_2388 [Erythrobacter dokdonensis DSW-74]
MPDGASKPANFLLSSDRDGRDWTRSGISREKIGVKMRSGDDVVSK